MSTREDLYAFPGGKSAFDGRTYPGMGLRDYFAAKALPQVMRWMPIDEDGDMLIGEADCNKWRAEKAYDIADAMLAARALEGAGR